MHSAPKTKVEMVLFLQLLAQNNPWLCLMLASVLTAEQWRSLMEQGAILSLRSQVLQQVRKALEKYPPFMMSWLEDITDEVMTQLCQGRYWKNYNPSKKHPMAFLVGCSYQYARTLCRSYWRKFGRDVA